MYLMPPQRPSRGSPRYEEGQKPVSA
jgi:hypothetical protein